MKRNKIIYLMLILPMLMLAECTNDIWQSGKDGKEGQDGSNGIGISKIEKTDTDGLTDTYTITFTDGTTTTYTVTNGSNGQDGNNGKSAYEIYRDNYEYPGTEKQWADDLANGELKPYIITFKTDRTADIIRRVYKRSPKLTDIPAIPVKYEGNTGVWDTADFKNITSDMTVNAVFTTDGLEYEINGDEYAVCGMGTSTASYIFIPAVYNGKPVTEIYDYAFGYVIPNDKIKSVTIPNGVTSIGQLSFFRCRSLTSVTIPNSVTSIEYGVFQGCNGLTSIAIPSSVTSIGDYAFNNSNALKDVYYAGSEDDWKKISIGKNNTKLKNAAIHYNSN